MVDRLVIGAERQSRLHTVRKGSVLCWNFPASFASDAYAADSMHGPGMIKPLVTRVVVLILALWLPVQGIAAVGVSFCEAGMGDGAKNMRTDRMKEPCQHMPAMCNGATACKLRISCSFCSAFPVGDANRSLLLRPALALGLRMPWSLVTFVTTPPEHPPHTDFLLV